MVCLLHARVDRRVQCFALCQIFLALIVKFFYFFVEFLLLRLKFAVLFDEAVEFLLEFVGYFVCATDESFLSENGHLALELRGDDFDVLFELLLV